MESALTRSADGIRYRDLNKNGQLDPYEDPRLPGPARVEDLLARLTLEEKAGLLFHTMGGPQGPGGPLRGMPAAEDLVAERHMNHFNLAGGGAARDLAAWHNALQAAAERTRLGIPVTLSSDPRHAYTDNPATSLFAGSFSLWPEPLGLAAIGDPVVTQALADIARQEYLAVGIRVALHPMADLATEPRWARINGTFGEDADLAARMVAAYIRGFQGATLGTLSVACMTKHFPGGGPQKDGEDPHFPYGKEQVYPGNNFAYHLLPFASAFRAGTAQIMPYYGVPIGIGLEEVAFGFNREVVTGLLRETYHFDGVVCTDWGLLTDLELGGRRMEARAWGVEHLSRPERAKKALDAGVDQFGGEACPDVIVELVRNGRVDEARLDTSVRRLLREKFRLGLFDQPFVDPSAADHVVGATSFRAAGAAAQRRSLVLLKNGPLAGGRALPLRGRPTLYIERMDAGAAAAYGEVVSRPEEADLSILRIQAPYEARDGNFLEQFFHAGDLSLREPERSRLLAVMAKAPAIVVISLDRPAVIPELAERSAALLADFGASDEAILDVVFGRAAPTGKLPVELPSSMAAARAQLPDVPHDSANPLFPFGFGLTY
jgi:beta-glucosidase